MKRLTNILHPFLIAIFPVLALFSHNVDRVVIGDTLFSAVILLVIAMFVLLFFLLILRRIQLAAFSTSFFLLIFFSYGHLFAIREEYNIRLRFIVGLVLLFAIVGAWLVIKARSNPSLFTRVMNRFAGSLIIIALIPIILFKTRVMFNEMRGSSRIGETQFVTSTTTPPDIYYILVDGYASQWELANYYGDDNHDFLNFLTREGFYIVPESRSNYAKTEFSLSTILNLDYLEKLSTDGKVSDDTTNARRLLQGHLAGRFLKSRGYTYVHAGSWWDATYKNRLADMNINKGYMPEFPQMLYKSIEPFLPFEPAFLDVRRVQWTRTLYQFDELEKIPAIREPTFTFVHLITHSPLVFNEDGSFLEDEATSYTSQQGNEQYLHQLLFLNKKLQALVEKILATSEISPIIVIQSDHGSRDVPAENVSDVNEYSDEYLGRHLRNFSAYRLPGGGNKFLWETITPVNTFRVIFNYYFGSDYQPISDRSFMTLPGRHYDVIDVTDRVIYE